MRTRRSTASTSTATGNSETVGSLTVITGRSTKSKRSYDHDHSSNSKSDKSAEDSASSKPTKRQKIHHTQSFAKHHSDFDSGNDNSSSSRDALSSHTAVGAGSASRSQAGGKDAVMDEIKKEEDIPKYESDDDQENFNYMQIRMQNMKDNENFLASLGVFKAKEELQQTMKPPKKTSTQRGLKIIKEPKQPLPRRKSLRINRLDPAGNPLPEPDPSLCSLDSIPFSQLVFRHEDVSIRLPEGPVKMEDCVYSKYEKEKASYDIDQFRSFVKQNTDSIQQKLETKDTDNLTQFDAMSLVEEHVAKVVPERIFSLDWYPSTNKLMVAAGDKSGHIGFWDISAEEKDGSEIVTAFRPHVKPVSQLLFSACHKQNLYSSSYDGTLRCLDFEKGVFDEILSIPEEDDDLLRDFSLVDSNIMLVAHYTGLFSVVDTRTPSTSAENSYLASKKSLHTIHVNPQSPHHFITTGTDASINLWDFRQLSKKSPKSLFTAKDHNKTVSSAYFSPNGHQILSCSADDTILIYSLDNSTNIQLSKRIRHNNWTGRWLTKFRPNWHPTMDNIFVSGSMARPRRIEIFNSNGGSLVTCLESDNLNSVCSLNKFHPMNPTLLAGANSSGRLHVFM